MVAIRSSQLFARVSLVFSVLLALGIQAKTASSQTAPQLLPYTAKVIAGGGSTPGTAGSPCSRAGATPSGNKSTDAYGDGCLATEITLSAPHAASVVDKTGAIFFADYTNGLVRRIDPTTGIVTAVAGGASATPSGTAAAPKACGGTDTNSSVDAMGDGCLGTSVKLGRPSGLAFASNGDLYFSDYYNYGIRKITSTGGVITTTGVISTVVGNYAGTSASSLGYMTGVSGSTATSCNITATSGAAGGCVLRAPYGIAFDSLGDLLIAENYYQAIMAVNLNASGTNTVATVPVPAGNMVKIAGARTSGAACVPGTGTTTSGSGCYGNPFTNGSPATTSSLYYPYAVALDSANNLYIANENENDVAMVTNSTGLISNYAGTYPLNSSTSKIPATERAKAGTFPIGSDYGIATDPTNNVYVGDALNGYVWRIDAASQSMYVVAGSGSTATVAGSACPGAPNFTATDTFGDGCPAYDTTLSKSGTVYASAGGIFGVTADTFGDIYVGDENNNLIREVASGTQFGAIGATQTDYIDVHFAAGDAPLKSGGFAITSGQSTFTIGTPTYTTNSDNTTDYIVPVTAAPSGSGAFLGSLTVYSNQVPAGTSFALSGIFVQSPVTRTVVNTSSSTSSSCGSGTTYATTTTVTLTGSLIANGPSAPAGTITFYANGTQIGTPQNVTNLGTASAPSYGATLTNTFSTAGNYSVTAVYTPTTGSYFMGSTSSPVSITSTVPAFAAAATPYKEATVVAGGTALYSFTLTQTVYTGTITFACSGLPANSSCSFSPQTITGAGCTTTNTVALSIQTQQAVKPLPGSVLPIGRWTLLTAIGGVGMMLLFSMRRRGSTMRFGRIGLLCGLLLALTGITACGKGTQGPAATPSGTSTVTVTATGSAGATSSFTVQLTVQ